MLRIPSFNGRAACYGRSDLFDRPGRLAAKQEICYSCACLFDCHTWALEHEAFGTWAATGPTDRKRIRDRFGITPSFGRNGAPLMSAVAA